jgi:hypothetical protein
MRTSSAPPVDVGGAAEVPLLATWLGKDVSIAARPVNIACVATIWYRSVRAWLGHPCRLRHTESETGSVIGNARAPTVQVHVADGRLENVRPALFLRQICRRTIKLKLEGANQSIWIKLTKALKIRVDRNCDRGKTEIFRDPRRRHAPKTSSRGVSSESEKTLIPSRESAP